MNGLSRALGDIRSIRRQTAHSTESHGYRPATLASTGAFALLAAFAEPLWVSDPAHQTRAYIEIWVAIAAISAAVTASKQRPDCVVSIQIWPMK